MQFIILISFLFPTPNSLVYSFPFQKSGLVNFCVTLARHLLRILCTACHLHTTNCHHSYIFYFLVIILSPTYIGFNSNPNRTNGLISPHVTMASHHKNTHSQQKYQKLRKPPSSWSPLSTALRWLQF